jgi:hypothetical protein
LPCGSVARIFTEVLLTVRVVFQGSMVGDLQVGSTRNVCIRRLQDGVWRGRWRTPIHHGFFPAVTVLSGSVESLAAKSLGIDPLRPTNSGVLRGTCTREAIEVVAETAAAEADQDSAESAGEEDVIRRQETPHPAGVDRRAGTGQDREGRSCQNADASSGVAGLPPCDSTPGEELLPCWWWWPQVTGVVGVETADVAEMERIWGAVYRRGSFALEGTGWSAMNREWLALSSWTI